MTSGPFIDPVCGMSVAADGPHHCEHRGHIYHFCNPRCLAKFQAEPERYLDPKPAAAEGSSDAIYTCPMHPEIRQDRPGNCPKCGMTLEPVLDRKSTRLNSSHIEPSRMPSSA